MMMEVMVIGYGVDDVGVMMVLMMVVLMEGFSL